MTLSSQDADQLTPDELRRELVELRRTVEAQSAELVQEQDYRAAVSEVLNVIAHSPSEVQAVLDSIINMAGRLCQSNRGGIWMLRDGKFHLEAAMSGAPPEFLDDLKKRPAAVEDSPFYSKVIRDQRAGQLTDALAQSTSVFTRKRSSFSDVRTIAAAPLLRKGRPIGVITLVRTEVQPFSERQLELLTNIANQAVIAVENARLFEAERIRAREIETKSAELTKSLEYQTAVSDVLEAMSRSPEKAEVVLQKIVEIMSRLCDAPRASISLRVQDHYEVAASHGAEEPVVEYFKNTKIAIDRTTLVGRVAFDRSTVHIADTSVDTERKLPTHNPDRFKPATMLGVPLLRNGDIIGVIGLSRVDKRPFNKREIELAETFAAQAVIAIENARMLEELQTRQRELEARTGELTESLEYQTAVSEVLSVIARSAGDIQPVIRTIIETAGRLCGSARTFFATVQNGEPDIVEVSGVTKEFMAQYMTSPVHKQPGSLTRRVIERKATVHIPDIGTDPLSGIFATGPQIAAPRSKSLLGVPLLRDHEILGIIGLTQTEVKPFSDRQITLVETFAKQAVIAIENARLLNELQTRQRELEASLERQTATSDLLEIISSSPGNLTPVFNAVLEKATTICGARFGNLFLYESGSLRHVAMLGVPPEFAALRRVRPIVQAGPNNALSRLIRSKQLQNIPDIKLDESYLAGDVAATEIADIAGARSMLLVPMLKDNTLAGVIGIFRQEVRPFSLVDVELVANFARQAVIAIENARLLDELQKRQLDLEARSAELQESLEYQTISSEVLQVISRSPADAQPVFDTIVRSAARLCDAGFAWVYMFDGTLLHMAAEFGLSPEGREIAKQVYPRPPGRSTAAARAVLSGEVVEIPDVLADPDYPPQGKLANFRSTIAVPLVHKGQTVGALAIGRPEPGRVTAREADMLETFANQAVIAINNVGLFEEVQARTKELAQSVDELRSLGEVGQVVSSSLDKEKVLQTVLENACKIAQAGGGTIYVYDKAADAFRLEAGYNMTDEHIARVRAAPMRMGDPVVGESALRRETVVIEDLGAEDPDRSPLIEILLRAGVRSILSIPLIHQSEVIGALAVRRNYQGPFELKTVKLLEAFAAQSAIAVNNARLFAEIQDKSRQLELASQHKSQFVANMSHELRTPLAAMLGYAELMKEGIYGELPEKSLATLERIHSNGTHLLGLINSVLDLAKIEAGQFSLSLQDYAVSSVVETVRAATESLAATKKLVLVTDVAEKLPHGFGDEKRLTQVLLNLVGNAIKFTDRGEVKVSALKSGANFSLAVADTGPGIPDAEKERIFEEFHQIDDSNTRTKGGTGLGLAISKQIVEMHGGRIWVESVLGQGATFRIEIPIKAEAGAA